MRVASLPMYDLPEVSRVLDDFWDGLRRHFQRQGLTDVPDNIVHRRPVRELWDDPDLWLSQCCGYDLVSDYDGTLVPLATPHFCAPECDGADYASVIIVTDTCQATDVLNMRDAVCVINGPQSHSGMNSLRALVAPVSSAGRCDAPRICPVELSQVDPSLRRTQSLAFRAGAAYVNLRRRFRRRV